MRDDALHFYTKLSPGNETNLTSLLRPSDKNAQQIWTSWKHNWKLRSSCQALTLQPSFVRINQINCINTGIRTLARRGYRTYPQLVDKVVLTSFIEGLKSSTLSWELRKTKPSTAEEALILAIELDTFLALERQHNAPASSSSPSSISSIAANTSQTDPMDEIVKNLRKKIEDLKSSIHKREVSPEGNRNQCRNSDKNWNRSDSYGQDHYRQNFGRKRTNGDPTGMTREVTHETEQKEEQPTMMTKAPGTTKRMVSTSGRFDLKRPWTHKQQSVAL